MLSNLCNQTGQHEELYTPPPEVDFTDVPLSRSFSSYQQREGEQRGTEESTSKCKRFKEQQCSTLAPGLSFNLKVWDIYPSFYKSDPQALDSGTLSAAHWSQYSRKLKPKSHQPSKETVGAALALSASEAVYHKTIKTDTRSQES